MVGRIGGRISVMTEWLGKQTLDGFLRQFQTKAGGTEYGAICQELSKYRISLAGLTEIHLLGSGRLDIDDHTVIHSSEEQEHRRGIALVLDKKLSHSLVSWQAISSRILT